MPSYRLYCLDSKGHFKEVHAIDASDDQEAVIAARTLNLATRCELWDRARLVSILEPHRV